MQLHYFPKQLMDRIGHCELAFDPDDPDLTFDDTSVMPTGGSSWHGDEKEEEASIGAVVGAAVSSLLMLGLALYVGLGL